MKIIFPHSSYLLASSYKFSRPGTINCNYGNLPEIAKASHRTLGSLGVKDLTIENRNQIFIFLSHFFALE